MKSVVVLFLIITQFGFSQKMPVDYFNEGNRYYEEKKYDSALTSFKYIVNNHPKNELYPKALYNEGHIYFLMENDSMAIQVFYRILSSDFNEKESSGGDIMANPYSNYKHRASRVLSELYYNKNEFDSSLYFFMLSDDTYPYLHFCGNAYASNRIFSALRYADIYQKLNKEYEAIRSLLPAVFITLSNNSKVIAELKNLLSQKYGLKEELDYSLKYIYSKSYENQGDIYSRYFFKFFDTEIEVPGSFGGNRRKFDIRKAVEKIKETPFYSMITEL